MTWPRTRCPQNPPRCLRERKIRLNCGSTISLKALDAGPRNGRNYAVGCDASESVIARIRDEQTAVRREGDVLGAPQSRRGRRASVATEPSRARASDRRDDAFRADAAHAVVGAIGDKYAAIRGHREPTRLREPRLDRRTTVAAVSTGPGSGDRNDDTRQLQAMGVLPATARHRIVGVVLFARGAGQPTVLRVERGACEHHKGAHARLGDGRLSNELFVGVDEMP
jgi:hypothetical protein